MDSKDVKGGDDVQDKKSDKGRQNALLLVLLALVGGFGYLYFFTDVIRPQAENKPAEAPVAQAVKKPLPAREAADAKSEVKPAAPDQKPAEVAKPEPPKTAPAAPVAPAVQPQKPKEEPKKAEVVKTAEKKPVAPVPDAKAKAQKSAAVEKKPVEVPKAAAVKPAAKKVVKPGSWTVFVGSYVLEGNLAVDQAKVKKAGLEPVIKPGVRKKTTMNRLLLAEYSDRSMAAAQLEKLRKHTADAFILDQGGKHYVYAGSYVLDSRAASEKDRLSAAGFKLALKRDSVSIPSKNLTAGVFSDKKAADAAVKKLRDAGLKAALQQ